MRVTFSGKELSELKTDLAVCFAWEGDDAPRGVVDAKLRRALAAEMKSDRFKGHPGDRTVWNCDGDYPAHRFLVIGLGKPDKPPGESLRAGCARAAREAGRFSAVSLSLRLPETQPEHAAAEVRAAAEGAILGAYAFEKYLTDPARRRVPLKSIELAAAGSSAPLRKAAQRGELVARAVYLARDLVNEAPSRMTPQILAREATQAARGAGIRCEVWTPAEIRKRGLHALLAVSRGSDEPPRVVHLSYKPRVRANQRIVLVGKGVTFDSGGLNLKPGNSMLTMKMDMAGSAAVLAAMTTLKAIGCRAEVEAYLGLVENMTGGSAYKPGDILDTHSGKTVEVGNTDAEGRLVLCDLLSYAAAKHKPTCIVDLATLTGACVVALGTMASGLFTRHDALRDELLAAGRQAGEKLWPLPLYDEYLQLIQKGPADLHNVGGRWGGAITAALFLGEFVPREIPWAHLDVAGPAFAESDQPESPCGGTGAAVSTLVRWLERAR